jgi:glycine oxidase
MYPEFVHRLRDASAVAIDFNNNGTILFVEDGEEFEEGNPLSAEELRALEPELAYFGNARLLPEACVDPRQLLEALLKTAIHVGVNVVSGAEVTHIQIDEGKATGAITTKSRYLAPKIVNCAGAWSGQFSPVAIPTRPIKGQMLALVAERRDLVRHVIRGNGVYAIPRADGRIVIGSTVEDVGFDKRVDAEVIQRMHQAAAVLVPSLGEARMLEDWAGLRPCAPDKLPIMGKTSLEGYYVSTGHYRDGILLAPVAAQLMSQVVQARAPGIDIAGFSSFRF